MTDDFNDKQPQPRRRRRAPDDAASPSGDAGRRRASQPPGSAADDSMAALERLQSLTSATAASSATGAPRAMDAPPAAAPQPAAARRPAAAPQPAAARRPATPAPRPSRPRPAAAPRAGRIVARVAAPVVFLVAVLIVLSIVSQSGVIGGKAEPAVTPTPKATKTKSGGSVKPTTYKLYVVKTGDTMSGIAVKFQVSTSEIEALNPKMSSSTLVVGTKIKVPKPVP